jgi:uncharacterized protein YeaO (DUF488 family)
MLKVKRVYEPATAADGARYLVERLWPRGITKESLKLDGWLKDLGASESLRRWFGHDPAKWHEFCRRYRLELDSRHATWKTLLNLARPRNVTLLYSAHDTEHNNAAALKAYLEDQLWRVAKPRRTNASHVGATEHAGRGVPIRRPRSPQEDR